MPELAAEVVPDVATVPVVPDALEVAALLEPGWVLVGRVTTEPEAVVPGALAGWVSVTAGTLVTVGTDAAGVTWIWPSEYCETGARVEVGWAVVVMLAQGVVPTWTWPRGGYGSASI